MVGAVKELTDKNASGGKGLMLAEKFSYRNIF